MTTDGGVRCTCVPYYLCDPSTNTIRTDGALDGFGVIDIRFNPNACQDVLDVCCVDAQRREQPASPPSATSRPQVPRGCGIRNVGGLDFQLAGNTVSLGLTLPRSVH